MDEKKVYVSCNDFYISITLLENSNFPIGTISGNQTNEGNNGWYIDRLFVKPNYRKKGCGTYLLNRFILEVKCKKGRYLEVYPGGYDMDRTKQLKFYMDRGFKDHSKGKFVYYIIDS